MPAVSSRVKFRKPLGEEPLVWLLQDLLMCCVLAIAGVCCQSDLSHAFFQPCCRIWTRTHERCCRSFMDCTVCNQGAKTSAWSWWTTFCLAWWKCTWNLTWKARPINAGHPRRKKKSPALRTRISTSYKTCPRAWCWMQTPSVHWWKRCNETVW